MQNPKSVSSSSRESLVHESSKSQNSCYKVGASAPRSLHQEEASLERGRSPTSCPFHQEHSLYREDVSLERGKNTSRSLRQKEEVSLERSLERSRRTSRPF